jgi:alkylmercury lyase
MTRQPDLPDLGSGPALEHALLASAFRLLLDDRRPVSPTRLAEALAIEPERVERTLARLDQQGRIRRDQTGVVTGSHGLSLTATPHELVLEQEPGQERRYWTWCAWDAVGILAALDASGRIRSTSPASGAPIQLDFDHGSPRQADPDLVVFFADTDCCTPAADTGDSSDCRGAGSVIDDWCPLVNFFEDAHAARAWAARHSVAGTAVPLAEATSQGKAAWRRWIDDRDQPSEPIGQVGSRP